MTKVLKLHYHEHAEKCPQCAVARDAVDPVEMVTNQIASLKELYDHSCEDGQHILIEFWLNYKDDE